MADPQNFDVQAARQSGYSDDEIAAHLAQSRGFDIQSAQKNGYKTADIIDYLSRTPSTQAKPQGQPTPPAAGQNGKTPAQGFWSSLNEQLGNPIDTMKMVAPAIPGAQQFLDTINSARSGFGIPAKVAEIKQDLSNISNPNAPMLQRINSAYSGIEDVMPIPSTAGIRNAGLKAVVQYQKGNTSGAAGTVTGAIANQAIPAAVGAVAGGAVERTPTPRSAVPVSVADAASVIRDAVNPKSVIADKFQGNVADTLPDALKTAQQNGIDASSRTGLAQSFQTLSDNLKEHMQRLLDPVANNTVNTGAIDGYSGKTVGENTATYQQLFKRLGVINAELKPKFDKGGGAGAAAVKSESELNAEADGIRSQLYPKIAQANGMPVEDVADLHQRMGKAGDVADIIMQRASKTREQANAEDQGQKLAKSGSEYFLRKMNQIKESALGNPADRAIAKTVPNVAEDQPAGNLSVLSDRPGKLIASFKVGGKAVGQTSLTPFQDGMEVSTSQITKDMQGKGIGTSMYQQAAQLAKSKGAKFLYSDDQLSGSAQGVWQKLVRNGKAEFDPQSGRFRMALQ